MKPGQMKNIKNPGMSHDALVRQAQQSPGSANTLESSGQTMDANRLNRVSGRSSEGTAAINPLGRKPYPTSP